MKSYERMTGEELAAAYQSGDGGALNALMEKYHPMVLSIEKKYYLKDGESEDLIQEGRIGLFNAAETFDSSEGAKFSSYAFLCILNSIRHAVEKSRRLYNMILSESMSLEDDEFEIPDRREGNPEKLYIADEKANELSAYMKKDLSPLERQVLSLYMDGVDYTDIAESLGKSRKSIDNALQRARNKVSRFLNTE